SDLFRTQHARNRTGAEFNGHRPKRQQRLVWGYIVGIHSSAPSAAAGSLIGILTTWSVPTVSNPKRSSSQPPPPRPWTCPDVIVANGRLLSVPRSGTADRRPRVEGCFGAWKIPPTEPYSTTIPKYITATRSQICETTAKLGRASCRDNV